MKQSNVLTLFSLLNLAFAVPMVKRDIVTVTDEVVETIDITTTVWVTAGAPATTAVSVAASTTFAASSSSAVVTSSATSSQVQASSTTSTAAYVPTSSSSVAAYVPPTTSSPAPYVPPTTSSVAPYVPPTTSSVAPYVPPTSSSSTSAAPMATAAGLSSSTLAVTTLQGASHDDGCLASAQCSGDLTYYDTGLGACGITSSDDQAVVAISYLMMGTVSNGNPLCGRTIQIQVGNGSPQKATVVDKCMGCTNSESLDLSPSLFKAFADESVGRITGAKWWFTD